MLETLDHCFLYAPVTAEMDGLEATRLLFERFSPEEAPMVVALSADAMNDLPEKCLAVGMSGFVGKPFKVEDVEQVLAQVSAHASQP